MHLSRLSLALAILTSATGIIATGAGAQDADSAAPQTDADSEPQTLDDGKTLRSTTTTAPSSTALHVRDMNDSKTATPGAGKHGEYQERGAKTVFGIGRPSLVDFEQHVFGKQLIPEKYTYTSPDEMRRLGEGKQLQKENNTKAP